LKQKVRAFHGGSSIEFDGSEHRLISSFLTVKELIFGGSGGGTCFYHWSPARARLYEIVLKQEGFIFDGTPI
jgi:hypothetical protein